MFKINSLEELDRISKRMQWQYFEKLVAFVFEENGFSVRQNVVMKFPKGKRQFDVIAERFGELFLVECKKWSANRYKISALKKTIAEHSERCLSYAEKTDKRISPLIVTLTDEAIKVHEGVPIIQIDKLNFFLNSEKG